jgi:desulfoferrodoxin (superoxide reductase-like protein)
MDIQITSIMYCTLKNENYDNSQLPLKVGTIINQEDGCYHIKWIILYHKYMERVKQK